jgi:hypothetical protein
MSHKRSCHDAVTASLICLWRQAFALPKLESVPKPVTDATHIVPKVIVRRYGIAELTASVGKTALNYSRSVFQLLFHSVIVPSARDPASELRTTFHQQAAL